MRAWMRVTGVRDEPLEGGRRVHGTVTLGRVLLRLRVTAVTPSPVRCATLLYFAAASSTDFRSSHVIPSVIHFGAGSPLSQ